MKSPKCPDRDTLAAYSAGRLDDEQSDVLADHLSICSECQAEIQTFDDHDDTLLRHLRAEPDDSCLGEPQLGAALATLLDGAPRTEPSVATRMLGEYRLLEELGRGGMGRVYLALHTKLDRVVALKIVSRSRLDDPHAMARFEREMKAIGRLNHPNIVHAYDAREIDGQPVLIMEYIDGFDLAEVIRRLGRLSVPDACELVRQAALALQYAHEHELVHRDVKPSNLMLSRRGEVKLLDLGLARLRAELPLGDEMTDTGQAMGTADYMAPEQASDCRSVDIRADLYSLGCTLYKLLSGRTPYSGPQYRGTFDKMSAHAREPVPPLRPLCPHVPEELAAIAERLLAKQPAERFALPAEVAAALTPFCAGADLSGLASAAEASCAAANPASAVPEPQAALPPRRRRTWLVLVALGMLFFGLGGYFLGVVLTIKRNGQETKIEVPDGAQAQVTPSGDVHVTLPGPATPAPAAPPQPSATMVPPPATYPSATPQPSKPVTPAVEYLTERVTRGDITETLEAEGTLQAGEVVDVPTKLLGTILRWGEDPRAASDPNFKGRMVDVGTPVDEGTPLAYLDPEGHTLQVALAKAAVQKSQADLEAAKANKQSPQHITAAEADLRQSQIRLEEAQRTLDHTVIFSPVKGVVLKRNVNRGQRVDPNGGDPRLFLIATGLEKIQLRANVAQFQAKQIPQGGNAQFTVAELPNETFTGKVVQIRHDTTQNQDIVMSSVVLECDNPELRLKPTQTAQVQFELVHRDVLRAPIAATRYQPSHPELAIGLVSGPSQRYGPITRSLYVKMPDGVHLRGIEVPLGTSDGKWQEVSGPEVHEGLEIVVGEKPIAPQSSLTPPGTYGVATGIGPGPTTSSYSVPAASSKLAMPIPPGPSSGIVEGSARLVGSWRVVSVQAGKGFVWPSGDPNDKTNLLPQENDRVNIHSLARFTMLHYEHGMQTAFEISFGLFGPKSIALILPEGDRRYTVFAQGTFQFKGERLVLGLSREAPQANAPLSSEYPGPNVIILTLERYEPSSDERALRNHTWNLREIFRDGTRTPSTAFTPMDLIFVQDGMSGLVLPIRNGSTQMHEQVTNAQTPETRELIAAIQRDIPGFYRLDSHPSPKELTIWDRSREPLLGVYRLEGDTLEIAYHMGEPRPTGFESKPGSGVTLIRFQRPEVGVPLPDPVEYPAASGVPLASAGSPLPRATAVSAAEAVRELKALVGSWNVVAVQADPAASWRFADPDFDGLISVFADDSGGGSPNPKRLAPRDVQRIKLDRYGRVSLYNLTAGKCQSYAYQLDLTQTPWAFDFLTNSLPRSPVAQGSYALDGPRLKLCLAPKFANVQTSRPKSIPEQVGAGSSLVVFTLERREPSPDERSMCAGPWILQEQVLAGHRSPAKEIAGGQLNLSDTMLNLKSSQLSNWNEPFQAYYELDPAKAPKEIRLFFIHTRQTTPARGIYELDADTLRIAYREGSEPPQEFESKPDSGVTLLVFRRQKPETKEEKPAAAEPPAASGMPSGSAGSPLPRAAAVSAADAARELKALVGSWKVVAVQADPAANWYFGSSSDEGLIITDDGRVGSFGDGADVGSMNSWRLAPQNVQRIELDRRFGMVYFHSLTEGKSHAYHYQLDLSQTPWAFDLRMDAVRDSGRLVAQGIYAWDGPRLKLCLARAFANVQTSRPKSIPDQVAPGSSLVVFTLERREPSPDERSMRTGSWLLQERMVAGHRTPAEEIAGDGLDFQDALLYLGHPQGGESVCYFNAFYELDPAKAPKEIRLTLRKELQTIPARGIYELDGDTLRIAYREGDEPPKEFESKPDSGVTLLVFRRQKPETKEEKPAAAEPTQETPATANP